MVCDDGRDSEAPSGDQKEGGEENQSERTEDLHQHTHHRRHQTQGQLPRSSSQVAPEAPVDTLAINDTARLQAMHEANSRLQQKLHDISNLTSHLSSERHYLGSRKSHILDRAINESDSTV